MRKKIRILLISGVCFLPALVFGQLKEQLKPQSFSQLLTQSQGLVGLIGLDPSRFSMQHSYSLGYTSFGGHGFSQGVYLNTMSYRLSDPLQVSLQWGMINQPFGGASLYKNGFFLSNASVEYKPNRNFSIGVQYNQIPASAVGLSYRGYPYYYAPNYYAPPIEDKQDQ